MARVFVVSAENLVSTLYTLSQSGFSYHLKISESGQVKVTSTLISSCSDSMIKISSEVRPGESSYVFVAFGFHCSQRRLMEIFSFFRKKVLLPTRSLIFCFATGNLFLEGSSCFLVAKTPKLPYKLDLLTCFFSGLMCFSESFTRFASLREAHKIDFYTNFQPYLFVESSGRKLCGVITNFTDLVALHEYWIKPMTKTPGKKGERLDWNSLIRLRVSSFILDFPLNTFFCRLSLEEQKHRVLLKVYRCPSALTKPPFHMLAGFSVPREEFMNIAPPFKIRGEEVDVLRFKLLNERPILGVDLP